MLVTLAATAVALAAVALAAVALAAVALAAVAMAAAAMAGVLGLCPVGEANLCQAAAESLRLARNRCPPPRLICRSYHRGFHLPA